MPAIYTASTVFCASQTPKSRVDNKQAEGNMKPATGDIEKNALAAGNNKGLGTPEVPQVPKAPNKQSRRRFRTKAFLAVWGLLGIIGVHFLSAATRSELTRRQSRRTPDGASWALNAFGGVARTQRGVAGKEAEEIYL